MCGGVDLSYLLPIGVLVTAIFGTLIAVAILKHQLFDITAVIKKGVAYSAFGSVVVLVFKLSEHFITTYVVHLVGKESTNIDMITVAIMVAVSMPIAKRVERTIEERFSTTKVEF